VAAGCIRGEWRCGSDHQHYSCGSDRWPAWQRGFGSRAITESAKRALLLLLMLLLLLVKRATDNPDTQER
jgi:hypothetical protein